MICNLLLILLLFNFSKGKNVKIIGIVNCHHTIEWEKVKIEVYRLNPNYYDTIIAQGSINKDYNFNIEASIESMQLYYLVISSNCGFVQEDTHCKRLTKYYFDVDIKHEMNKNQELDFGTIHLNEFYEGTYLDCENSRFMPKVARVIDFFER